MEAEAVNAGTKFIIRDTAKTASRKTHRKVVCLGEIEARQRCTPEEKGCGHPL